MCFPAEQSETIFIDSYYNMFEQMAQPLVSIITTPIEKMCATMGIFGTDILDSTAESYLPRHHLRSRTTHESSGGSSPASATSHDPVKERRMQLARKVNISVAVRCEA